MTLHELHQLTGELLKIYSGDTEVMIAKDSEGNKINRIDSYGGANIHGYDVIVLWPTD